MPATACSTFWPTQLRQKVKEIVLNLGSSNPGKGTKRLQNLDSIFTGGWTRCAATQKAPPPILDDLKKIETTPP